MHPQWQNACRRCAGRGGTMVAEGWWRGGEGVSEGRCKGGVRVVVEEEHQLRLPGPTRNDGRCPPLP